ncbi:PDZ/DHR/GLGF domain protein [Opisthorchis viverrini]|uniref:PDZ/DHR/GLGF domain protein n=1 Tax=Opisthorchis viverrini TaxID=6198 RepID=A0A1S8X2Z9_OPIVI|nr:PDZ/DHR/GLGF domain protein [Opisthorchis viverrini]
MPSKKSFRKYVTNLISFANSHIRNSLRDRSNEFFAGEVTPELEELMRNVWQPLIGPDCDVIVLHIKKPKSASSLGISVEGVDWVRKRENFPVANGGELTEPVSAEPRHFVQSIVPGGLLGSLNIIQPGDELLQVNGRRLRGMSRTSTVRCLRNLPSHIELVLSRARQPTRMFAPEELALLSAHGEEPPLEVMASEVNSVDTTYSDVHLPANSTTMLHNVTGHPPTNVSPRAIESRISEWVRRSVVDLQGSSAVTNSHDLEHLQSHKMESGNAPYPAESHSATLNERRSYLESFRHLHHSPQKRPTDTSHLATMPRVRSGTYRVQDPRYKSKRPVWSSVPLLVQLTKSERGFGFSLSEYESFSVPDCGLVSSQKSTSLLTVAPEQPTVPLTRSQSCGLICLGAPNTSCMTWSSHPWDLCERVVLGDYRPCSPTPRRMQVDGVTTVNGSISRLSMLAADLVTEVVESAIALLEPSYSVHPSSDEESLEMNWTHSCSSTSISDEGYFAKPKESAIHETALYDTAEQLVDQILQIALEQVVHSPTLVPAVRTLDEPEVHSLSIENQSRSCSLVDDAVAVFSSTMDVDSDQSFCTDGPSGTAADIDLSTTSTVSLSSYFRSGILSSETESSSTRPNSPRSLRSCCWPVVREFTPDSNISDGWVLATSVHHRSINHHRLERRSKHTVQSLPLESFLSNSSGDCLDVLDDLQDDMPMPDIGYSELKPLNFHVLPEDYQQSDLHDPYLDVPPVEKSQEKFTQIVLLSAPIGIKLDALAARGQDGCRIVQIFDGGAVCRSNVLQPNDYITELDGHSMRHVTNLEAFQLLRHSSSRDGTVDFVQDSEKNGRAESYTEPFGFIEQVIISRNADESSWGLNLAGEEYLPALPENVKAHLFNPTCVQSIKPDSPAERCGCLQPGDIILKIADTDVVHAGPAYVRHLLQDFLNQGTTQVSLGVRFSTVAPTSEEVNNKSTTVAEVERRSSLADRSHSLAPGDRRFSKGIDELDREDSPSSFSQVEAPEPLSEMDSRDELNVLSRSIESPVHRIGTTADSGVGQQDDDDIVPLSSLACPVLPDESVASESLTVKSADKSATDMNGTVNAFRVGAGLPPAPPTRRFSRETAPFSVEDSISNLPVITKDPVSLYERDEPAGDKVIPVEIELPWPLVNGSGDMPSPKFESLGIHLVGSIHPNLNATYVAGLTPGSVAAQSGTLQVGDEVVQVGQNSVVDLGRLMVGRCITRAVYQSIKRAAAEQDPVTPTVFLVVRRNPNNMKLMASITSPDRSTPEHPFGLTNGLSLDHPEERTQSSFHLGSGDESELLTPPVSTIPLTSSVNHLPVSQDLLVQVHALLDESPDLYDIFDTEIQRNSNGYGIFIVNYGPQDKPGVFVSDLAPNGAAAQHGELCPNDRILAVNGQIQTDYDSTLSLMKQSTTRVRLTIARRKAATQSPSKAVTKPVATSSPAPSALTNAPLERPKPPPIIPGRETLVELTRHSGSSWGFSVVGGKDTVLGGILVHAVHDDGIVAEDGRIAVGDRLLAVNGVDLRDADHETGKKIIRNAGDSLRLLIYREPPTCLGETEQPQEIEVTIVRKPGESLGLSLFGRSPYSTGTAIAAIVPGTPAAQCGLLKPGDVVLEINGLDYRLAQYQEVAAAFKAASGEVRLKVQREPPSSHPTHPPPVPSHRLKLYVVVLRRSDQEASRTIGFQHALLGSSNLDSSFGLSIRQASPEEVLETGGNLIVEDILPGSPAALSIMIQPGDRLLTVDREPVDWLRPDEVFSLLSGLTECTLELGRLPVAPYPVDPGLSTACFPQDEQPPYPCSVELPEIFDVEMPIIEPPPGVRSMDTLEEEKPRTNFNPGDLSIAKKTHLSSTSSSISSTDEAGQIAQRSAAGFQVRQVCLPPALPGSTLGIRLAKAHGISGPVIVRIMPDSVASQTPLRVGDRILGLDDKLLLLLDSDTTPRQLLARIKEAWLARGSSLENPVRLTVVGASDHQTQNGGVSSESENDRVPATSTMNDGFPTEAANPRSLPKINGPLPASRNPPNSQSYPTLHGLVVYGREEDEGTLAVPGAAPATYTGIKRTSLS